MVALLGNAVVFPGIMTTIGLDTTQARSAAQAALRQGDHAQPKVVFCTTENDIGHIRAAIAAGADEYVMKPFDRETLHIKLQLVGVA